MRGQWRAKRNPPRFVRIRGTDVMGSHYEIIQTPEGALPDGRTTRPAKYPFGQLEVGQSFIVPQSEVGTDVIQAANTLARIKTSCQYYATKLNRKFRAAQRDDGTIIVGRVE